VGLPRSWIPRVGPLSQSTGPIFWWVLIPTENHGFSLWSPAEYLAHIGWTYIIDYIIYPFDWYICTWTGVLNPRFPCSILSGNLPRWAHNGDQATFVALPRQCPPTNRLTSRWCGAFASGHQALVRWLGVLGQAWRGIGGGVDFKFMTPTCGKHETNHFGVSCLVKVGWFMIGFTILSDVTRKNQLAILFAMISKI